ncbi:hypothetical protein [Paracoccus luteus]|uniref:hypothetical protein n=1 Tax=Paracoccus luteus TaxID=2508543 RepID=UPI00106F4373|nr:hypothetical protein [Paracoccus luteus]
MRWLRLIIFLVLVAVAGLFGYAYFGDMDARPRQMRVPVELDLGGEAPSAAPAAAAPAPAPAAGPVASPAPAASDDPDAALD